MTIMTIDDSYCLLKMYELFNGLLCTIVRNLFNFFTEAALNKYEIFIITTINSTAPAFRCTRPPPI